MSSRRPITDKRRCEFVRARFEPLNSTGQLTPLAELAGRFVREQAVISKAMRKAFKDRLIGVDVRERRADRSERVPALERAMLSSFGALLDAIVIDTEQDRHSKPTIPEPSGVSDRLHETLGRAMAQKIAEGPLVHHGDTILCGPGRGVFHTVQALADFRPLRARGVRVISLTGAAQVRHHGGNRRIFLDADYNAAHFTRAFVEEVSCRFIHHHLVTLAASPQKLVADRLRTHGQMPDYLPNRAIVGLGAFSEGHSLFEQAFRSAPDRDPALGPVYENLTELAKLSQRWSTWYYSPIGDIANRLFFVEPPSRVGVPVAAVPHFRRLVDRVNGRLVTISEADLKKVREIFMVAGTSVKSSAIRQVLTDPSYPVRIICTDSQTARIILDGEVFGSAP